PANVEPRDLEALGDEFPQRSLADHERLAGRKDHRPLAPERERLLHVLSCDGRHPGLVGGEDRSPLGLQVRLGTPQCPPQRAARPPAPHDRLTTLPPCHLPSRAREGRQGPPDVPDTRSRRRLTGLPPGGETAGPWPL